MSELPFKALFEELFVANRDKVFRFALKLTGDASRAEEITQLCFIKLWENMHKVREGEEIFPLLFVFAKNIVIDETRRLYRERENQRSMILQQQQAPDTNAADQALLRKEVDREMRQLIDRLPEQRRNIYLMSRENGKSYKEIAEQLSISPLTVRNHLQLAMQHIKRGLTSRFNIEAK